MFISVDARRQWFSDVEQQPEPLPLPERIELTGKGGREAVYELRGYFVAGGVSPVIVGTVFAIQNDVAEQPPGTSGPFVLFPAK